MRAGTTYDDLIKGYYGGRRHGHRRRHRQASDYGKPYRGREADEDEHLLTNYYGHDRHAHHHRHHGHVHEKQLFDLASSVDDGETLGQAARPERFEEYVVAASLGNAMFEEYVVDQVPMAGQASLCATCADPPVDPQTEYLVDVADPLGRRGDANRFDPEPRRTAPAAQEPTGMAPPAPVAPTGAAAPSSPQPPASPPESGAQSTPEDDFISDMKSILTRQKVYDPLSKKMVDADKLGQATSAEPRQGQETSGSQAIFDKIAKSMQYANAYDLGTVELENRFADFDRMSDLQQKADSDKRAGRARAKQSKDAVAIATAVDSQDFIQDLDEMHHQRQARRSDDDPFAYVPPDDPLGGQAPAPGAGWTGEAGPGVASAGAGAEGGPPTSMPGMQMPKIQIPNIQVPNIQIPNIQMPGMPALGPQTSAEQSIWSLQQDTPLSPFPARFADPLTGKDNKKVNDAFKAAVTAVKTSHPHLSDVAKLPIIIVPLFDDNTRPFTGQNVDKQFYAGSMLKIGAMFAAFQLRHAVNHLAATLDPAKVTDPTKFFAAVRKEFDSQILKASDLIKPDSTAGYRAPQYDKIFTAAQDGAGKWSVTFRSDPDSKLDFDGHLKKMVVDSHNPSAGVCIQALGFSWIDGLSQKVGLFNVGTKRGIWLAGDYLMTKSDIAKAHAAADGDADGKEEFDLGISGWAEVRIPSENDGPSKQCTTCIDAARLFVLLFDQKLVATTDPVDTANDEMLDLLRQAVAGPAAASIVNRFPTAPAPFAVLQSKIGVGTLGSKGSCNRDAANHTHGCVLSESLIGRQAADPQRRFVAVWQNVKDPGNEGFEEITRIRELIQKTMDGL
jgi:hypothetical protein